MSGRPHKFADKTAGHSGKVDMREAVDIEDAARAVNKINKRRKHEKHEQYIAEHKPKVTLPTLRFGQDFKDDT